MDRSLGSTLITGLSTAFVWGLALMVLSACAVEGYDLEETRTPVRIGDTTVEIVFHDAGAPGLTYLNLHDDEDTAVEAALDVVARRGGRVVELRHTGERNISFALGDTTYTFDPNRIFSDAGIDTTLTRHGDRARRVVRAFADTLLQLLDPASLPALVTIHNNTENNYSALSYADGGSYAGDVRFVHIARGVDPDDFFFVTEEAFYRALRDAGFNVVMQDNVLVTDDGSLSVYAGRAGVPYVNAEAQHGHFEYQIKMLEFMNRLLQASE